jgi:hypothetical protein
MHHYPYFHSLDERRMTHDTQLVTYYQVGSFELDLGRIH